MCTMKSRDPSHAAAVRYNSVSYDTFIRWYDTTTI